VSIIEFVGTTAVPKFNHAGTKLSRPDGTHKTLTLESAKSALKTYDISAAQGAAALAKISATEAKLASGKLGYQLFTSQCATFACAVARAAGVKPPAAGLIAQPRKIYDSIKNEDL
ncbi:hypothetical protein, partial [Duganella sp. Root336D2]|uniref:hypothetical protein n=1 Tax=Duganella sp. Root336D2 TaxID=1736518 RepID=UPI00138F3D03